VKLFPVFRGYFLTEQFLWLRNLDFSQKKGFLIRSDNQSGKFKRTCSTARMPHNAVALAIEVFKVPSSSAIPYHGDETARAISVIRGSR